MTYHVEAKIKLNTDNENEQSNAEWFTIGEYNSKRQAVKIAKSKSKCKKWYESHVTAFEDPCDNPSFDRYYKNGKLEFSLA